MPEVGRVLHAAQFFLERPMGIIAHEDRGAVAVTRDRQAARGEQLLEDDGIAVEILRGTEVQGQHVVGGIVEAPCTVIVGPRVPSQAKGLPSRCTSCPIRASGCGGDDARGARRRCVAGKPGPGPDRRTEFAAEPRPSTSRSFSVGVAIVEVLVEGLQQGVDLGRHRRRQAARGRPAAAAVPQARRPLGPQARFQPLDVAGTQA